MPFASAALLFALAFGAETDGADAPNVRPSEAAPPARDTRDERARGGLLPRKPLPRATAQPSVRPVTVEPAASAAPAPARPATPNGTAAHPVPGGASGAAVKPAAAAEEPAADSVVRLADVILGALRGRSAPPGADAEQPVRADTSIEDLHVRVSGARVDSVLVGRAGAFTITAQTGTLAPAVGTAAAPVGTARPQVGASAPAGAPAPDAAPARAAARAPVASPLPAVARVEPTPAEGPSQLLLRRTTAAGDVIKRTLDPSSGLVTERRLDRAGRLVAQSAIDVRQLTLVSQARDEQGRIVQIVQDASGTLIRVLRDPVGRFLHASVVER